MFFVTLLASVLIGAAASGAVLFGGARRLTAPRLLASSAVLLAVVAFEAPFLVGIGFGAFALLYLLYLHLAVTLPLQAILVLLAGLRARRTVSTSRPGITRGAAALAAVSLAFVPVSIQATFFEPYRLKTETAAVPLRHERTGQRAVRIGVLSDIQTDHVSDYERSAIDRLMALEPDLVLIPGDLFQGWPGTLADEIGGFRDLLSRLHAPGGVYFVLGDADSPEEIEQIIDGTQVKLLINQTVHLSVGDRTISLCGLERRCQSEAARRAIREFAAAPGDGDIRILCSHYPDSALELEPGTRVDLVIAGHTHGGQVQVPFFGPLITLSRVPRAVAAGGLHDLDGRRVYVSRGVGHERRQAPPLRFNCPPEVSLVTVGGE